MYESVTRLRGKSLMHSEAQNNPVWNSFFFFHKKRERSAEQPLQKMACQLSLFNKPYYQERGWRLLLHKKTPLIRMASEWRSHLFFPLFSAIWVSLNSMKAFQPKPRTWSSPLPKKIWSNKVHPMCWSAPLHMITWALSVPQSFNMHHLIWSGQSHNSECSTN